MARKGWRSWTTRGSSLRLATSGDWSQAQDDPSSLSGDSSPENGPMCAASTSRSENVVRAHVAKPHRASRRPRVWGRTSGPCPPALWLESRRCRRDAPWRGN